ncbi:MAG: hypothetical protein IJK70_07560 [Bacteroidales bacterium]|nr:hypothetical protein [Bacteroidales bacterium]
MNKSFFTIAFALLAAITLRAGNHAFDAVIESRENPIKVVDSIATWSPKADILKATAGEYFTFQIGVKAYQSLDDVKVVFKPFKAAGVGGFGKEVMTCFNCGGISSSGEPFTKKVDIAQGKLQPLWIGVDLTGVKPGIYKGKVIVSSSRGKVKLPVSITVGDGIVEEKGCSSGNNLSRMSWLNSTLGQEPTVTKGFNPLKRDGNVIKLLGRELIIGEDGFPAGIKSYFNKSVETFNDKGTDVLSASVAFIVTLADGNVLELKNGRPEFNDGEASISWIGSNKSKQLIITYKAVVEFDGWVNYDVTVKSRKGIDVKDISLVLPVSPNNSAYTMGLGLEGGLRPKDDYHWKWDVTKHQDMLWIGNVDGGIRLMLKDENYKKPLVNIYYEFGRIVEPVSWSNGGKGGVDISSSGDGATVKAFSGERHLGKGDELHFNFELLLTPFKLVDRSVKYGDRYYHGGKPDEFSKLAQARELEANIVNIHHASSHYPFINYPYLDECVDTLKMIINEAHEHGQRLKVYYTTREITKNIPEFWAFNSLQGEVLFPGPGNDCRTVINRKGPSQWLKTNMKENYIPAWYNDIQGGLFKGEVDLSVITTPDSRLNNFYIGGLDWMLRNMEIDGVYIDDSALDRVTVRRARRLIDQYRPEGRIDMHSWNHFCAPAGYANCLNIYMDLLPYIDLTWIGEGRDYNRMPDHWLIEVASIPFGLSGQMLQGGGNRWCGMVYGMTNRAGWSGNYPNYIWSFWDKYDIASKELLGYWDERCPVSTDNDMVKASLYKGENSAIIAVACWGDSDVTCDINIDWAKLGLDRSKVKIVQPAVTDFQEERTNPSLKGIKVPQGKGYLFVIQ